MPLLTSCSSFAGESALLMTDFCFIFDCTNGILGGTIDPCAAGIGINGDPDNLEPLLIDCPQFGEP